MPKMRMKQWPPTLMLLLLTAVIQASGDTIPSRCPMVKMEAERLPDLTTPRAGHIAVCTSGELMVIGGHTTGFVPTATAEYFSDGTWHQLPTTYAHDHAFGLPLSSGKILIAGGHDEPLGVGQTFTVETYDPATHTFSGYGCLNTKRTLASGTELDSGRVMLAGNWYHDDGIEMFDGQKSFYAVKDVSVSRMSPFIFRTSGNNAIIVGNQDNKCNGPDSIVIDQLHGEPFSIPLLQTWRPLTFDTPNRSYDSFIGDTAKGVYKYLMPVQDFTRFNAESEKSGHPSGRIAIALVEDTVISLLPTVCPIPVESSPGNPILYYSTIVADRKAQRAYLAGTDKVRRLYLLSIDYALRPAPLTLYYTDPLPDCGFNMPVLTQDGNLAIIGGCMLDNYTSDHYTPTASAWLIRLGQQQTADNNHTIWLWLTLGVILLAVLAFLLLRSRRRSTSMVEVEAQSGNNSSDEALLQRISNHIEQNRLYLNSDLKMMDIADAFNVHRKDVSVCINSQMGCSFAQFINTYRVEYAQQLLRKDPDMKIISVALESGFSNERSFFRAFKSATGLSPKEWVLRQID